jgi:hypothetical protein
VGTHVSVVDTRHDAPPELLAHCGETVKFEMTISAEMADDGHLEGATNLLDTQLVCH